MAIPKLGTSAGGQPMHYSVGALIERDGKYLFIDRTSPPYGWAGPAGHVDEGEDTLVALIREIEEEVGLKVTKHELLCEEEVPNNRCKRGVDIHYWWLFKCEATGEMKRSFTETKAAGWFSPKELKTMALEPVWQYWLEKLKIL